MAIDRAVLNALTRRWQLDELGLDQQAANTRTNYRQSIQELRRTNKSDKERMDVSLADRGLARSGIAVKENLDLQESMNRASNNLSRQKAQTLASVARKRLEAKAAYDEARAMLMLGLQPPAGG